MEKICFKCGRSKPLTEYYAHPKMSDGFLGKCKTCTKDDVKRRAEELKNIPEWAEQERKRGRRKYHRLYEETGKSNPESFKKYIQKYPEKRKATGSSRRLPRPFVGAEAHHWSYNDEHFKNVIWLSKKEHNKAHRFIEYDQSIKMYRTLIGVLLDNRVIHEKYIRLCIQTEED